MENIIKVFYIIFIFTSGLTVCFAPFGLIFSSLSIKTVHFNLRVLIITLGIFWCTFPIGGLLFYFILDAPENPPLLYLRTDYQIAKNICAISGYAFRVIETCICFERLLATIFFETYESKKIFRIYSLIAIILTLIICASFSIMFNIFHVPAMVLYIFLIVVETTNFVLLFVLQKQNHKLRKMKNSLSAHLTSKYQLIENIKSLNLLFPQTTISFIMSNGALLITIILRIIYNELLNPPIFYIIYNLNVVIISIYWITQSPCYKRIVTKLGKFFLNGLHDSTDVIILKATTVKTALGHTVNIQQTGEDYFKNLRNVWK